MTSPFSLVGVDRVLCNGVQDGPVSSHREGQNIHVVPNTLLSGNGSRPRQSAQQLRACKAIVLIYRSVLNHHSQRMRYGQ